MRSILFGLVLAAVAVGRGEPIDVDDIQQPPQLQPIRQPPPPPLVDVEVVGEINVLPTIKEMEVGDEGWISGWAFKWRLKQVLLPATVYPESTDFHNFKIERTKDGFRVTIPDGKTFDPNVHQV